MSYFTLWWGLSFGNFAEQSRDAGNWRVQGEVPSERCHEAMSPWVNRVDFGMSALSPLHPHEPTSWV